jgi:hypothetical protein
MRAPRSLMAAIGPDAVTAAAKGSPLFARYGETVDRESAYEKLTAKIAEPPPPAPADAPPPPAPEPRREREEPSMVAEVLGSPVVKSFLRSAAGALGAGDHSGAVRDAAAALTGRNGDSRPGTAASASATPSAAAMSTTG